MNELILTSELKSIRLIESFLYNLQKEYDISQEKFIDIKLSIMEAVNNAIIHGNKLDAEKKVKISERKINDYLTVQIQDQGKGFDPSAIKDPTTDENIHLPGGRGVHLMRHLTDELAYENNGNSVILRFKI